MARAFRLRGGRRQAQSLTGKCVSCQKVAPGFYRIYAMPENEEKRGRSGVVLNAAPRVRPKRSMFRLFFRQLCQQHLLDEFAAADVALFRQFVQGIHRVRVDFQLYASQSTHFIAP